ncbi:MAG TPA: methylmalonyl Co-A mutase-associated GTPase MeaB [Syntrophales bacterium]|nr:methylmalonyl Co-A mutase-associated GTPase MeaB [Syntrophales bacterium]
MERAQKIREGDVRTASRLIRDIEDNAPEARQTVREIFCHTGNAHVVGITGSPGAGKSTLVNGLIELYRTTGRTVGVLAVDPTSPFTGGAILGDRIRMQRHAEDPEVFVRSMATRGTLGGLTKAVGDAIHVLDAMGKDLIIVETVGAGQQEVQIMNYAHTVVLVLVPGMGDEIQILKAGIMEIADIFVINKADREGTHKLQRELIAVLDMSPNTKGAWRPPVLTVENVYEPAKFRKGIENVAKTILDHYGHLVSNDTLDECRRRRSLHELNDALTSCILEPILNRLITEGEIERMADQLLRGEADPITLAEAIAGRYLRITSAE